MKKEEITLKNTKAEILEALNQALEREKNINKTKSDPQKEEVERKKKESISESKENIKQNIFSDELITKFKNLEMAIEALEEKLKNLYGLEGELNNFTLVVNAEKDFLADLEIKKKVETEKLETSIQELEAEFKKKNKELEEEYAAKAKALKLERDREVEEYEYKLKRDREIVNNKWEDEKKIREVNLKNLEDEAKKKLKEVTEKETYLKELEQKVEGIPEMMLKEYERGRKEATAELKKEQEYQTELLKKDFQNTIDRQADKIKSLEGELEKISALNVSMQDKMDKAYVEMKELATKTVEANGQVKIFSNNQADKINIWHLINFMI